MASLRQRKPVEEAADIDEATDGADEAPKPWHASISVRSILILLAMFGLMHLFLWKVVYDFAMATNHERLRGSVGQAIDSLYTFLEHL
eukprot:CAMPEP_0115858934 /NCGR_PEP_ID=MMETSP0287-20121206/16353_1 /TAXON_ID=412157 /ORGANISM="Chrysochromulina rotalis, Strain UIO044" /LENGTH=87 /DNA_ID=CAMNT_0003313213 /DNA_START=21 /DNA_END=284 /DNA_ORIENTATION=-